MRSLHQNTSWLSAFLLLVFAAGCRDGASAPESPTVPAVGITAARTVSSREFYPLAVGNEWTYQRTFRIEVEILDGAGDPVAKTFEGTGERRIIGREEISGREYFVEQSTLAVNGRPNVTMTRTRFRQDHAGLYVADVAADARSGSMPLDLRPGALMSPVAKRAWQEHARKLGTFRRLLEPGLPDGEALSGRPGGILPGEILFLSFPLHPKSAWFNRVEPFVVHSEVEAREVLDLPAGRFTCWRVRIDNEFLDPTDRVVVWYGRCGRLSSLLHAETLALDPETGEIARVTSDETERLTGLALLEPEGCDR
jgi:hypothetical protein